MGEALNNKKTIREYLLGRSSSEDAAHVEDRLLTDGEFYQEVLIVEDELFDQYLAGQLTDPERESFDKYFLATSGRGEKLRFSRNLKKYVSRARAVDIAFVPKPDAAVSPRNVLRKRFWSWSNPVLASSLATATVFALAFTIVLIVRNLNAGPNGPGRVLAVELTPGLTRGDEGIRKIPSTAETTTLALQLRIPNNLPYQTYRAILQNSGGREISCEDNLRRDKTSNDRITCPVPANLLTPGDYNLKLSGLNMQSEYEDVARYSFGVSSK